MITSSSAMRTTLVTIVALIAVSCGGGDDDASTLVDDVAASADGAVDAAADAVDGAVDEAEEAVSDVVDAVDDAVDEAEEAVSDVVDAVDDAAGEAVDEVQDAADGSSSGTNTASVTIGDETFDFEWEAGTIQRCDTDFFGGFWALDAAVDGGSGLEAQIWPDDAADPSQVSKINVDVGDDVEYTADPENGMGSTVENWPAQVDSFEIDGNTVTGTATFVQNFAFGEEPEGVAGTFEITCGG